MTSTRSEEVRRMTTGIEPLDELLGGGIVAGAVIVLHGQPGSGRVTVASRVATSFASRHGRGSCRFYGSPSSSVLLERAATALEQPPISVGDLASMDRDIAARSLRLCVWEAELPSRDLLRRRFEVAHSRGVALLVTLMESKGGMIPLDLMNSADVAIGVTPEGVPAGVLFRLVSSKNHYGKPGEALLSF